MSLTPLDVGVQRFLEFTVTLVFQEVYSPGQLDAATQALLSQWPTLGSRLNSLRTDLIPSEPDNLPNIYAGKPVDKNLEDVVDISKPQQVGDNVKKLDKLFNFANGLKKALHGQVFQVRALLLQNATVIRFVLQHPFCDATGGYTIAQAYCDILSGKKVPDVSFTRTPLRLNNEIMQEATTEKNTQKTPAVLKQTRESFTWSWRALLGKAVKLAIRDLLHPRRVDETLYIPDEQMRIWQEDAKSQDINVTDHDLLTAFIYQSAYEQSLPQDYAIIFGIRRQLQNQTPMHNSCFVLPINIDSLHEGNQSKPAALPKIAAQVRRTILQARQPECLSELLQFHSNPSTRPMIPRWIGRKAPQVSVTSWNDLPFFNLDARGTRPTLVFGELDFWRLLKKLGLSMEDIIISWKGQAMEDGDGGYWIRGKLDKAAWERMAEAIGK